MQRACYADMVARSHFDTEAFTAVDDAEYVVGFYAQHEAFDYERWLFGGLEIDRDATALSMDASLAACCSAGAALSPRRRRRYRRNRGGGPPDGPPRRTSRVFVTDGRSSRRHGRTL